MKLPITILKYHSWYLCQISLQIMLLPVLISLNIVRTFIKRWGPGISPGYYEHGPRLLLLENRRKIEPKEIPSHLIPHLLVVFTRQLEILVTTLLGICVSQVEEHISLRICVSSPRWGTHITRQGCH